MKKSVKIALAVIIPAFIVVGGSLGINYAYLKDRYTPLEYCYYGGVAYNYAGNVPYSYKEVHLEEEKPPHLHYYCYEITIYDENKFDVWNCVVCFYSETGEKVRYKVDECKKIDCDLIYTTNY